MIILKYCPTLVCIAVGVCVCMGVAMLYVWSIMQCCLINSCIVWLSTDKVSKVAIGFSQPNYNTNESSGNLMVTLLLRRSVSTGSITVTVIPSEQSPLSAIGKR